MMIDFALKSQALAVVAVLGLVDGFERGGAEV